MPLLNASGKLTLLRVHEVGSAWGPASDRLDVEVVIKLNSQPDIQLRNDGSRPVRQGMLDLLRDAFNHDWIVNIDYEIPDQKKNGRIIRVWLTKPVAVVGTTVIKGTKISRG